ncbi:putative membrane-bound dehydrogenase-like protein [Roseimicrobium gellanilyticum]|uniref:Putative membrane-bound dehydrogenase-like protein n=1 Tax=Roseimicrobium gellanilyticum TaxID=748857 RepID=A0A366HF67_9BACT|nr:PVC-type heme-binding CxxCH protein [Roseimicrobium gellanilyticum]RBP40559.1 putative membrane-bound dehydrogenase-like protein [Roseimicrobium gellanilyticum]
MNRLLTLLLPAFLCFSSAVTQLTAAPATLAIREGDHICIIGNTLAERMQFPGHNHFETLLYQRFPKHNLVVRNLSWSADEVALRPRAEGFGTPDEHLTFSKADVVIAFFGFNESFAGEAGLEKFKTDLEEWIKHTKAQSYNGKGAPRIALVSPMAAEDLENPNLLTGDALKELNARLALYTKAMQEVAEKNGVVFANVFEGSGNAFELAKKQFESGAKGYGFPLTINGVHLKREGDAVFGMILQDALFSTSEELKNERRFDFIRESEGSRGALHAEIESKNFHWYNRYRIVDSYYVYGGRSGLKFADGDQTNRDVMQREREVLDVMVANRDARIWKLAQGEKVSDKADDSNVPPFLDVKTWFGAGIKKDAGANTGQTSKTAEGSSAEIPTVAETQKKFTLAKGFKVECFASEENFPELANATAMAFDTKGRLWVCTMPSYPQWRPGDEFIDKIIILEDSDGDGKANYCNTFADKLHLPISFEFYDGGILVSDQRNLTFLKDTNGDDKADFREVMLSGFDSADSHHVINAFTQGPGGDLYFQEGTFHYTQVETPYGPVRCANAGTYRYEPRTQKLSVFVSYNYANPHGIAFDQWGQTFIADASGGMNYFATAFSGQLPYPEKHASMKTFLKKRVRPTSGCEFVSSRNFPEDMQGNFLLNNCIGVQGTLNHTVKAVDSGYEATEIDPLMLNSDPNFRPVDMEFAPDGSLYIVDWAEALIGHMQYSIRDPLRDHKHGRIWRIWNAEKPLVKPVKVAGEPIKKLLELLSAPEYRVRERVKQELSTRKSEEVLKALDAWVKPLRDAVITKTSASQEHQLVEALWVYQYLNKVDMPQLHRVLTSGMPEARAAAVRVLCYWQDRVPDALDLLTKAANDPDPLVRLEAVRACSFSKDPKAANVALEALKQPQDYYITYTLGETMRALKPSPSAIDVKANPAALTYVLGQMTNDELKAAPRVEGVLKAQLERKGLDAATREAAAVDLAKLLGTTREVELVSAIMRFDDQQVNTVVSAELGKLLASSSPQALKTAEAQITRLAFKDHGVRSARVAGMAAYVTMTGDPAKVAKERQDNHETISVLLESIVIIPDPVLRAKYQTFATDAAGGTNLPPLVRKAAIAALPLTGAEFGLQNFGILAKVLLKGEYRDQVAQAAMQIPRTAWDKSLAPSLVESILSYAKTVPANQRTEMGYVEVSRFGTELCALLPAETGPALRKSLRELGVSVFVIRTVREQMRYDTPEITVEAGKPFEVIFENNDIMPHNIIFCKGGTHAEVGTAAQTMPATPDAKGFLYVPKHPAILDSAYSKMLEPGEKSRLQLTAPGTPGEYEYVCTFPGHWVIMWGKMKVVAQLE